mgnify:CR=1 FL=1
MDFNVTLSFDAKHDTPLINLDGEAMPLLSISIVLRTYCYFYGFLSPSHFGQVVKACGW